MVLGSRTSHAAMLSSGAASTPGGGAPDRDSALTARPRFKQAATHSDPVRPPEPLTAMGLPAAWAGPPVAALLALLSQGLRQFSAKHGLRPRGARIGHAFLLWPWFMLSLMPDSAAGHDFSRLAPLSQGHQARS